MAKLPPPINGTEDYLAAVHDRLGEQNDLLARILDRLPERTPAEEPSDVVELREPVTPAAPPGEDGPGAPGRAPAQATEVTGPAPAPNRSRPARKRTTAKKMKES